MSVSRREFFRGGLATAGVAALTLRADALPTLSSGTLKHYPEFQVLADTPLPSVSPTALLPESVKPTEDNILGPYFREGAPFRAKVTPPLAKGVPLLVRGRVWGFDTKKPLSGALLDIWQADADGRYDNDDPNKPPAKGVYINRVRVLTDETGYYEFETIHPGPYKTGPNTWRPAHIHYLVRKAGYANLITQLYFQGDKFNAADEFIKPSLIIKLETAKVNGTTIETGVFDVVLAAAQKR
jgi:catechol 1,2-dioxygenase